jgi:predicted small secreted protein
MRKLLWIVFITASSLAACNNHAPTEKDIDSINQAVADSLLNDALQDSVKKGADSLTKDNQ